MMPELDLEGRWGSGWQPIPPGGMMNNPGNKPLPFGFPGAGGQFPGGGQSPYQSPWGDISKLAGFGGAVRPGAGPSYFSTEMLGGGIPGFGAPRTTLGSYYGASPDQRSAQDYMYQLAGYDPQQLAYERASFTPGARMRPRAAFGGF